MLHKASWVTQNKKGRGETSSSQNFAVLWESWRRHCVHQHHPALPRHPSSSPSQWEAAFHWTGILPSHCRGEQMASHSLKLYFLATCLKLQLPDMANEFYNQKLKWISCSRCFFSGNYQTFLAAHLSFKRIKLCTSIMCCHWSIAQLYQTFFLLILETELIFCKGFFFNMRLSLITFTGEHVYCKVGEQIIASRKATFKRKLPSHSRGLYQKVLRFCEEEKINYYFNNEAKPAENPLRE